MSEILVVIPCLNEECYLEKLVRGILAANSALLLRIVIVDGGSKDKSLQIAEKLHNEFPSVAVLNNPKRLQSAGINLAVARFGTNAEYLIRMDVHAEYPDSYIQTLIGEASMTQAASVVVSMNTVGKEGFQKAVAAAQNSLLGNGGAAHRRTDSSGQWVDHGHHALMRIDAFRAAGGYDETFSHNEDAELDARLKKAGYKIWLTGRTALTYHPRSSPLALFRQYMGYGEGRVRNILTHGTMPRLRQLAPALVAPALLMAIFTPFAGIVLFPAAFWAVFCLGYGAWLAAQAEDITVAAAGPAAMIMHFGWSLGFWKGVWVIPRGNNG